MLINLNILLLLLSFELEQSPTFSNVASLMSDSTATVSFSFVGDIMCHSTQFKWAQVAEDSFDFRPNYKFIKEYLESADFTVGNLETVINTKSNQYTGYPVFNTPKDLLEALKYAGFDWLTTANNHATDGRKEGIINTINAIAGTGMNYSGTFLNKEDRDSLKVFNKNNISFTLLSYSYGLNIYNLKSDDSYMVNLIDTTLIKRDILKAEEQGVDVILIYLHIGNENAREPSIEQKEIVKKVLSYGADIIVSSSSHTIQPVQLLSNMHRSNDSVLVAYSLGNFISNQRWRYSDSGVILNFNIHKNLFTQKISLGEIGYLPVWIYKGLVNDYRQYVILPSESYKDSINLPFLDSESLKKMKQSFTDTKQIINKVSKSPKLLPIQNKPGIEVADSIKVN